MKNHGTCEMCEKNPVEETPWGGVWIMLLQKVCKACYDEQSEILEKYGS